jgi:hypothetical protein
MNPTDAAVVLTRQPEFSSVTRPNTKEQPSWFWANISPSIAWGIFTPFLSIYDSDV